jgi:hypothetical protein
MGRVQALPVVLEEEVSDELPEWPTDSGEANEGQPLCDQITDFLQDKFNSVDKDLGPQIVGDWLLVAEVVTSDGRRGLRIFDSDLPIWRKLGLVTFLQQDAQTEGVVCNILDDEDDD